MNFWNGNKSPVRQQYELDILKAALSSSNFNLAEINNDLTDYPKAEDEGNIFNHGCDALVTVAGNRKFLGIDKIIVEQPITKGLLGYRLLIIKKEKLATFKQVKTHQDLQCLTIGIPATWADADLFRSNNYQVIEEGLFEGIFERLNNNEFDYVALGANEIEQAYQSIKNKKYDLVIEPSLMLYYPFPLVFYVNKNNSKLAQIIENGLMAIAGNGELEKIFHRYYGDIVNRLYMKERLQITLDNPILPNTMQGYRSELLD